MRSTTIKINGLNYTFTVLDARAVQEYLDWAKKEMPDPVDEVMATANKLPDDYRKEFIDKNLQPAFERLKLRGTITDPDFGPFSQSPKGLGKFLSLMLRPRHPGLTEDEALNLVAEAFEEYGEDKFIELMTPSTKVPMTEVEAERRYFPGDGKRAARRVK